MCAAIRDEFCGDCEADVTRSPERHRIGYVHRVMEIAGAG